MAQSSTSQGGKLQFGNVSNNANLSNLFGGHKVFNLGAGSSNMEITTNSVDLSSYFKDDSTYSQTPKTEGGGFDAALSLGLGVGGGSGSGGSVEKITSRSDTDNSSFSANKSSGISPIYVGIGILVVGILGIILLKKRRNK